MLLERKADFWIGTHHPSGLLQNQENTVSLQEKPTEKALYLKKKKIFFLTHLALGQENISLSLSFSLIVLVKG